jgi:heterodisulfide reductase subunit B
MRYPGIESATRAVFDSLGIDYKDIKGFSCCPALGVTRSFDKDTWLAIGARNLVIAQQQGMDVITICNGCFGSLFDVAHILDHNDDLRDKINGYLKEAGVPEYKPGIVVKHFAEVLHSEVGLDKIKEMASNPQEFNVGIHYGCHFLKPSKEKNIDNPERPKILEDLVEAIGATNVEYNNKQMCCGAGGGVRARNKELTDQLSNDKLDAMNDAGVDVIVDVCPFCHLQYDMGQEGRDTKIPVLHMSQLYGLAMGLDKSKLGLELHVTPVEL